MNITITDVAREKLAQTFSEMKIQNPALRILFKGFGWGGPRLGLALEELENENNIVLKSNDIPVVLEARVKDYLEIIPAITVNYTETWFGSGFVIEGVGSC